jgi:uncharacterized LabA/DUF88 family protein
MSVMSGGPPIYSREWMLFVDGENLTIRGQRLCDAQKVKPVEGAYYKRDCFLWLAAGGDGTAARFQVESSRLRDHALRAYYYTSLVGDYPILSTVRNDLCKMGFSPEVFKKDRRDEKAKGVDIALTKDMLSHGFRNNYEIAVLVAGDADYVPVVEELKRLGKLVYIWFFAQEGLHPDLRLAADYFKDLTEDLVGSWMRHSK